MLYIVDQITRQLENVFKLHDEAISSVRVSHGFCATGSQDCYLRVWPLDFSEFFLEAKHEQQVSDIDVKMDGLKVLCGNNNNGLGVVDLTNQSYRTVLRSHIGRLLSMDGKADNLLTLGEDGTLRVWDLQRREQSYEFNY